MSEEQQNRLNSLEVSAVPSWKGENSNSILNRIVVKVGFILLPIDIYYIHWVRKFPSTTISLKNSDETLSKHPKAIPNIIRAATIDGNRVQRVHIKCMKTTGNWSEAAFCGYRVRFVRVQGKTSGLMRDSGLLEAVRRGLSPHTQPL
ncbi:hypothetical protein EVAR_20621_1 [Eumeta japonica]|uniref:Uncharacterized protein n=1 Tax=Eumeta variegata TaxID=151549 RepID=A0A4C1V9X4_EUMVA|nr:hypothetical protein EVAR_20621_1 [Eumeta japonica]